jgi:NitT/TauT family transport system permease protein
MKQKDRLLNYVLPIMTVIGILAIWGVSSLVIDNEYILPSISQTIKEVALLFGEVSFYRALFSTLFRSLIAFIISFALAGILVILSIKTKYIEKVISPIIRVMRALPTIAVVLLLLFWTNSKVAPVIVTLLVVLPTTYTHLKDAFWGLDKTVSEAGRVDGAGEFAVLTRIEIPQIMASIYSAIGSGISLNFKLMVAAEVLSQTANSIGFMLNTYKVYFEISKMLAIVVVTVIFGVIIERVFDKLSKKANSWK